MATIDTLRQINGANGGVLTADELASYAEAIASGYMTIAQVRNVAEQRLEVRQENRQYARTFAQSLGIPQEFLGTFVDSYIDTGDTSIALAQVRDSPIYEEYFPGNKLPDGRVRFTESQYNAFVESYAATLEDYGLNPDAYREKFVGLIEGEVAPDEFAGRIESLYENVIRAPDEVRQGVAAEFGIDGTVEQLLGVMIDPDIADQVRARRLSIGQITGQAQRFGFNRSRARIEELMNFGLGAEQAGDFYSNAARALPRLSGSAAVTGETFGLTEFEDASVAGGVDAFNTARRLSRQQTSRFSRAGSVITDRSGALRGLDTR